MPVLLKYGPPCVWDFIGLFGSDKFHSIAWLFRTILEHCS